MGEECSKCGRRFKAPTGLGLHWNHAKRNPSLCRGDYIIDAPHKDDAEKPRFDLVPPVALQQVAEVMTFGAKKYAPKNYLNGNGIDPGRLIAAALRHINAHLRGAEVDADSSLGALAHAAASLMMTIEVIEKRGFDKAHTDAAINKRNQEVTDGNR